ncbi:uncharacterized protein LOC144711778 isoform X2 [Wolffia australiana]
MRKRELFFVAAFVLCFSAIALECILVEGGRNGGDFTSGSHQWRVLTRRNFSSQIRFHDHVLVMVTVPWSGESRSLMNKISSLILADKLLSGLLKLMVVYKNLENVLAESLDAKEGITFRYYYLRKSFNYQGRLNSQKILSSVSHAVSIQQAGFPFTFLRTVEEAQKFLQSTDKAVLLLEFCGWSDILLSTIYNGSRESSIFKQTGVHTADFQGEIVENNGEIPFDGKEMLKGLANDKLTCTIDPWFKKFSSAREINNGGTSCTSNKFREFQSFFSELNEVAREFALSPQRQRFAVISDRSLLEFLSLRDPADWQLLIHVSGVPSPLNVLENVDELRVTLRAGHPIVNEVDGDQKNRDGVFPVDKPSFILFIDRTSDSSLIREQSMSALDSFRQVARHFKLINADATGRVEEMASGSEINKGKDQRILSENTLYTVLRQLLHQHSSALKLKGLRLGQVAKDVGFHLLSDDLLVDAESDRFLSPNEDKKSVAQCEIPTVGSFLSIKEFSQCRVIKRLAQEKSSSGVEEVDVSSYAKSTHQAFTGSFFFSDGGYRLLRSLTGSKVPSMVILDPVHQQHYILPEKLNITFETLVDFVERFMKRKLVPHRKSEALVRNRGAYPEPPFVNLDFHEAGGVPSLTADMFEEVVLGLKEGGVEHSDGDKLVLFFSSWCGFCHRMELVLREVYRALRGLRRLSSSKPADKPAGTHIYRIDCTLNDCSSFFFNLGKAEDYPSLILYRSKGVAPIAYKGPASVLQVFKFLDEHASNSQSLHEYRGVLRKHVKGVDSETTTV